MRHIAERVQQGSIIAVLALLVITAVLRIWYFGPVLAAVFLTLAGLALVSSVYLELVGPSVRKAGDTWFVETVRYYMQLGFFGKCAGLTDEELLPRVKAHWTRQNGDGKPSDLGDILLLSFDKARVFWGDLEADVAPGNKAYISLLKSMAKISRHTFEPTSISEAWEGDNGPLRVEFMLNGVRQSIQPKVHDDWLDAQFIVSINRLIKDTGMQFWVYDTGGQDLVLIALTDEEAKKIRRERHLSI